MLRKVSEYRVAYADTDKMGFVYYGNYLALFARARTELMRQHGLTYRELEATGTAMPVIEANLRYHSPAHYDDVLDLCAAVREFRGLRITIACEVRRNGDLLADGTTTLTFMDAATGRPRRIPDELRRLIEAAIAAEGGRAE